MNQESKNRKEKFLVIGSNSFSGAHFVKHLLEQGHPNDVGTLLDQQGVAVRAGHHCNMPLMQRLGVPGTVRASFSLYNNDEDVTRLLEAVEKASTFL